MKKMFLGLATFLLVTACTANAAENKTPPKETVKVAQEFNYILEVTLMPNNNEQRVKFTVKENEWKMTPDGTLVVLKPGKPPLFWHADWSILPVKVEQG